MKVVRIIVVILIFVSLMGCSVNENIDNKRENIKNNEYVLISTNDRLVFKKDNNYEIVYFENDKIIKVETAVKYKTEEEAERNYKIESKKAYYEIIKCYNNVLVKEEMHNYWEDYKELSPEDLKVYYKKAGYDYIA